MLKIRKMWKNFRNKASSTGRFHLVPALFLLIIAQFIFSPCRLEAQIPPFPSDDDTNYDNGDYTNYPPVIGKPFDYGDKLYLLPPVLISPNTLALTITNPANGAAYDLLSISNLLGRPPLTNWQLLARFAPGQQSLALSPLVNPQGFYILRQSLDSDNDGTPDYLEDLNGNGVVDSGETDPNSATDLGLKVQITCPRSGARVL